LVAGIQGGKRLTVFENSVLRRIFGPKREVVEGDWKNYVMKSFMLCTAHQNFSGDTIEKNEMVGACSAYGEGRACTGFWL
jgi:hypothetical protein